MRFSVVIPAYNYGRFLRRAVDSVLSQDGDDYEVIVVDDGSTDDTAAVAASLAAARPGRVRWFSQANAGPSAARNAGADRAAGDSLIFLDADDRLLPGALAKFRAALDAAPGTDLVFGGHQSVFESGRVKTHPAPALGGDGPADFARFVRRKLGSVVQGAAAVRRARFARVRYPAGINHNEDVVLIGRLLAGGPDGRGVCVSFPDPVVAVHKHAGSLRHDADGLHAAAGRAAAALFDPDFLPPALRPALPGLRREYEAQLGLSLFSRLAAAGRGREARGVYFDTVRAHPRSLLRARKLWKFVRTLAA